MPNKPVTVRRWEVVGAFALLVAVAFGVATWNDHQTGERIDKAEKRISVNAASIAATKAKATLAEQSADTAKAIATSQRSTVAVLCGEIKSLKGQLLLTLEQNRGQAKTYVGRIPGYTREDAELAEKRLEQAIERFKPRPCPPRPD